MGDDGLDLVGQRLCIACQDFVQVLKLLQLLVVAACDKPERGAQGEGAASLAALGHVPVKDEGPLRPLVQLQPSHAETQHLPRT